MGDSENIVGARGVVGSRESVDEMGGVMGSDGDYNKPLMISR